MTRIIELRPHQDEEPRRIEEGENQEQHRVDGIAGRDDHDAGGHGHGGEHIKGNGLDDHGALNGTARPP
jgi:hypothetical protein